MPISYDPKDAIQCWSAGDYPATLEKVEDKISKAGNAMQKWTLRVYNDDGREQVISDYAVVPSSVFKIRQLALALNQKAEFESGLFQPEEHVGANLTAELGIEKTAEFGDQNKVKKLKSPNSAPPVAPAPPQPRPQQQAYQTGRRPPVSDDPVFQDADIPF